MTTTNDKDGYNLKNLFHPNRIANQPDELFGRGEDVSHCEELLGNGYVAISGATGIGKSSLLFHVRLKMEGFGSNLAYASELITCTKDFANVEAVSSAVVQSLLDVPDRHAKWKFGIKGFVEYETGKAHNPIPAGGYYSVLRKFLIKNLEDPSHMFLLALDEVDKAPVAVARFIRNISNDIEHEGINGLKIILILCLTPVAKYGIC